MRVTIDRGPEGRFELARARPAANLAGAVVRYAGDVENAAWSLRQREVATSVAPLIIDLGPASASRERRDLQRRRPAGNKSSRPAGAAALAEWSTITHEP